MSTAIIINSTTTDGKSVAKSVGDINPNASAADLKLLAQKINALTTNTYGSTVRVDKTEISGTYYDLTVELYDPDPTASIDGDTITLTATGKSSFEDPAFAYVQFKINNGIISSQNLKFVLHSAEDAPNWSVGITNGAQNTSCLYVAAVADNRNPTNTFTIDVPGGSFNDMNYNGKTLTFVIINS